MDFNRCCPDERINLHVHKTSGYYFIKDVCDFCGLEESGDLSNGVERECKSYRSVSDLDDSKLSNIVQLHNVVYESGLPNYQGLRIPLETHWNVSYLRDVLKDYSDYEICDFIEFGFPISYLSDIKPESAMMNHKGAMEFPEAVDSFIETELSYNALIGPFETNPLNCDLHISPINTVPKDESSRRVIVDLSWPSGQSVNSGIDKDSYMGEEIHLSYPSVDDLARLVIEKGQGSLMFKTDLKRAYRQILVDPGDIHFLCFRWKGQIYIDRTLPFGLRSAAYICQRVTSMIKYVLSLFDCKIVNFLDDFGGADSPTKATQSYNTVATVLTSMGVEQNVKKSCPPSTVMVFLGVLLDSVAMELRITEERLQEIRQLLPEWLHFKSATRRQLQSLVGKLQFVSKCVRPSRVFIARILAKLRGLKHNNHKVRLNSEFRKDIRWWLSFVSVYNGVSMIKTSEWSSVDVVFSADACLTGCGAVCVPEYFHKEFPEFVLRQGSSIVHLECLTLVVAIKTWCTRWKGLRISIFCDNEAVCSVINSGKARDPYLQSCMREIMFCACMYEFEIRAVHLSSSENRLADCLSRWHLDDNYRMSFLKAVTDYRDIDIDDSLFMLSCTW